MPSLPTNPNLENFRWQAKSLLRAARSGNATALQRFATHHPARESEQWTLGAAQLVVARGYGFSSWPGLRHYLDDAAPLWRDPTRDDATPNSAPADRFCLLACLVYDEKDGPERWAAALGLLREHPEIVVDSLAAAAAAADPLAIGGHLAADRGAAGRETGPHRWAPLMYLTYSRAWLGAEPADRFLDSARLLLDAGADPNAGYLYGGLPTPFTVLTGVFGEGEQGANRQPRHPHSTALARLLLTRGAEADDQQALYNRMFRPDDSHLRILFEFGLGSGDGGPWKRRLGEALESPAELWSRQLTWAIDHGFDDRVRLLIAHGIDVRAPLTDGRTPAEHAVAGGRFDLLDDLRGAGAAVPAMTDPELLAGLLLAGDTGPIDAFVGRRPSALAALRRARPDLVHRARTPAAVAALVVAGFDANARHGGSTALHQAAFAGDTGLIGALLAAGADPSAVDGRYAATPLGWAEFAGEAGAVQLLAPGHHRVACDSRKRHSVIQSRRTT